MKKAIVLVLIVMFAVAGTALAVGPGKNVDYDGKGAGKVMFSGDAHKAMKCPECHATTFKMKKGSVVMTMKDMEAGKECGTCHNGTKAFGVKDAATCAKCHKK